MITEIQIRENIIDLSQPFPRKPFLSFPLCFQLAYEDLSQYRRQGFSDEKSFILLINLSSTMPTT